MTTPVEYDPAWLPLDAVTAWIGAAAGSNTDAIDRARKASARYCEKNRRDLFLDGVFTPDEDVVMAGLLGAARVYARKGSPAGLATYAEFATAILSYDPDVERHLGIGRYAAPEVG